jgi:hypothetical protein
MFPPYPVGMGKGMSSIQETIIIIEAATVRAERFINPKVPFPDHPRAIPGGFEEFTDKLFRFGNSCISTARCIGPTFLGSIFTATESLLVSTC